MVNDTNELINEIKLLRYVYEDVRGVLRNNGIDSERTINYLEKLYCSIDNIKILDSGQYTATEILEEYENN